MAAVAGRVQDTGFAWVVCVACFLIQVVLGGFMYTPGMFYIMFKDGLNASDSALAFITSLNICLIFLVCPVMGFLTGRYGERLISLIGVGLSTVALACCSFSSEVYQLYMLYSVAAGISLGMTYSASITIIPQYFNKYMRVATCITLCGPSVGSFIFPPVINTLENQFGWRGAILIIAGINAQTAVCCCFFRPALTKFHIAQITKDSDNDLDESGNLRESNTVCWEKEGGEVRVRPVHAELDSMLLGNGKFHSQSCTCEVNKGCKYVSTDKQHNNSDGFLQAKVNKTKCDRASNGEKFKIPPLFRNVIFLCLLSLSFFISFSIGIVGTHFGNYGLTLGYTKSDVVLLYMVWGITSTITRLMIGIFAQVTHTNSGLLIMVACILNGFLTIVLPHIDQLWFLYLFAVLHQLLLSFYNILNVSLTVESVGSGQTSIAIGFLFVFCTPGLTFGPPIAAWLYGYTLGYSSSFYLSGILLIMAGLSMTVPAYRIYKLDKTK